MISFLKGALAGKSESGVIIDVGGVGYSVSMTVSDIAKMGAIGEGVKVFTHFHMSENAVGLFGFLTNEQIEKLIINLCPYNKRCKQAKSQEGSQSEIGHREDI